MTSEIRESISRRANSSSNRDDGENNDTGDFECNICFELAEEPIVTLCGHLFCWPCLYKWLHFHSRSQECPVCKALIQEEKLVPLYGRGKTQVDPRSRPIPGVEIPNRPAGQRPATAPPPLPNDFPDFGFGFMGGFVPMATARFRNFAFSAGIGGPSSLFGFHGHGFHNANMFGPRPVYPHGLSSGAFDRGHFYENYSRGRHKTEDTNFLKMFFLIAGVLVILARIL